ncbi:MAG: dihydroorotase [Hyphomicrobiales bacterium]|nr:dihydroorotase [Hyphomicrobiales bacterium]
MDHRPLAFLNARLLDPAAGTDQPGGLLAHNDVIVDVGPHLRAGTVPAEALIIDCAGDSLAPGLIDARVFVGEPGAEHRETIASITRAAAAGGVTTLVATPDTDPPVDNAAMVDFLLRLGRDKGRVRVLTTAALTRGLRGEEIAEIGLLLEAGALAFSQGAHALRNAQVMRRAMTYARDFDALVMHLPQDADLAADGVMNEGELASRLGLAGISTAAETIMLERDLRLVALTGARYHASLISCKASLELISHAKARGLPVTCGVSINHLALNETDIGDYRTFFKIAPPLRSEEERRALVQGLRDGIIDIIVSDHCPQDVETKRLPFGEAAFGAIGVETLLAVALRLVHADDLPLVHLLRALSLRPAEILRLPQGRLAKGAPADLVRFDPDEPWVLQAADLHSRSRNTPFDDARLTGRVKQTWVAGTLVHG